MIYIYSVFMKKTIITAAILLMCFVGKAQTSPSLCSSNFQAKEGTYEIISHSKRTEVFTTDILCQIESRRDDKKIIEWEVSALTTIRIKSRETILLEENQK